MDEPAADLAGGGGERVGRLPRPLRTGRFATRDGVESPVHAPRGDPRVAWHELERLVEVTTWILGPHRYPLVLARPDDGGPELLVDWYPPDRWPPPFDDVATGQPPYLRHDQYDMRTTGVVRPDEVLDAVEVVEELDPAVWATRPPPPRPPGPSLPTGPPRVLRPGRRRTPAAAPAAPPLPRPSGVYADLDGQTYAAVSAHKPRLRLLAPGQGPVPAGFEEDGRGVRSRLVPRTAVTRIVRVTTWARWRGHEVEVVQVSDGRVRVQGWTYPPPDEPAVGTPENTYWEVWTAPQELDAVREDVVEVPR
ncbi:hypothetical protein [Cellulomonas sp. SLBN-39]|uniref:hypothetical protein n=1 Tax=Cellulomonas sp. SLBN-39 TaxID=2768446 RepID=UPI00114FB42C|nr:hypothetical protein [Cellulomonas sp. SLBN-39]TQL01989.1 hypothetical protein FBY24_1053 [Cellulomonas sp. SLBN-39]